MKSGNGFCRELRAGQSIPPEALQACLSTMGMRNGRPKSPRTGQHCTSCPSPDPRVKLGLGRFQKQRSLGIPRQGRTSMAISLRPRLRQRGTESLRSPGSCFIASARVQVPNNPGCPDAPVRLTQASQHDSNGAEVGKSTESICCKDFCSDLELQKMSEALASLAQR